MNTTSANLRRHARALIAVTVIALVACAGAMSACASHDPTATPTRVPTPTFVVPSPLPDDVLIANTRKFLSNATNSWDIGVDAEGDGHLDYNCLQVLEGGPGGFQWSVEQRSDNQWVVRLDQTASLVDQKTGTWLAIVGGGVGTTADSINCNDVPQKAYRRDHPDG